MFRVQRAHGRETDKYNTQPEDKRERKGRETKKEDETERGGGAGEGETEKKVVTKVARLFTVCSAQLVSTQPIQIYKPDSGLFTPSQNIKKNPYTALITALC